MINAPIFQLRKNSYNYQVNFTGKNNLKMQQTLNSDTISFNKKNDDLSSKDKMTNYAIKLLDDNNLQKGQKLYIKGDSKYLPFIDILSQEAYKKGSGLVKLKIIEPEIENLKQKYKINETFDFEKKEIIDLKKSNALFLTFDNKNNPYKSAKLTPHEIEIEEKNITPNIPKEIRNLFNINPQEILKDALDIHKGQPITIHAEREHLPYVTEMVDWLYSKNNSKLVEVKINNNSNLNMYKFGNDNLFDEVDNTIVDAEKEYFQKDVAQLYLEGSDPNFYEGIDTNKIVRKSKARTNAIEEYRNLTNNNVPWLIYYAPTTKSSMATYQELKDKPLEAITKAYKDANIINRVGKLGEHLKTLDYRVKKVNNLLEKGYNTFHYVSLDKNTQLPDGKTDFKIKMSPKSEFKSARMDMKRYGHRPIVNIPTEEIFSAPNANSAEGRITATKPFNINGKLIDGIEFEFKDGKVIKAKATKNEDMLISHIKENKNADRLGEIALVAGSPIAKTGRIFNSVLLDENAACHFALGNAYPETVKGASSIDDYKQQKTYLEKHNINVSKIHNDFMVGGENIAIYAINDKTGDKIDVIKNDKFLL